MAPRRYDDGGRRPRRFGGSLTQGLGRPWVAPGRRRARMEPCAGRSASLPCGSRPARPRPPSRGWACRPVSDQLAGSGSHPDPLSAEEIRPRWPRCRHDDHGDDRGTSTDVDDHDHAAQRRPPARPARLDRARRRTPPPRRPRPQPVDPLLRPRGRHRHAAVLPERGHRRGGHAGAGFTVDIGDSHDGGAGWSSRATTTAAGSTAGGTAGPRTRCARTTDRSAAASPGLEVGRGSA